MKRFKWLFNSRGKRIVFATLFVLVAMQFFRGARKERTVILAATEVKSNFTTHLETEGQLKAGAEYFLSVKKGGRLDRLVASQGQVTKGEIVAIIDEVANRSALRSALSAFRLAATEQSRMISLFRSGAVTQQDKDQAFNQFESKKAELEQAKQRMEDSIIRSPVNGHIALVPFQLGDTVPDGSRVAVIEDRSQLQLGLRIDNQQAKLLADKISVDLMAPGSREIKATSQARVQKAQVESGLLDSTVDVTLIFENLPAEYTSGQTIQASLPLKTYPNLVLVDPQAVAWNKGFSQVALLEGDGTLRWSPAEIGARVEDKMAITNLAADAKVILPTDAAKIQELIRNKTKVVLSKNQERRG